MSTETDALKAEAERAVRRGELLDAVGLYQQLLAADPDDSGAAARLQVLSEQVSGETGSAAFASPPSAPPAMTAEQRAEKLLENGDARGALATYAEIVRIRPDHALAAERKREIEASLVTENSSTTPREAAAPTTKAVGSRLTHEEVLRQLLTKIEERRRP
jgi:hypothetical protein